MAEQPSLSSSVCSLTSSQHEYMHLSKRLSHLWKVLTPTEKSPYEDAAREDAALHKEKYPDYKYEPQTLLKNKRRKKQRFADLTSNDARPFTVADATTSQNNIILGALCSPSLSDAVRLTPLVVEPLLVGENIGNYEWDNMCNFLFNKDDLLLTLNTLPPCTPLCVYEYPLTPSPIVDFLL